MSGYNEYPDLFDAEGRERQDGGGLRKQLEEALGEIRTLRNELNSEKRTKTVTEFLKGKGKDPAAASLIPQDADPEKWFNDYGSLLADARKAEQVVEETKGSEETKDEAAPEVPDPALDQERMAMETLAGVQGTGIPSTATADPIQKIKSFETEEELLAFIRSQQ